MPSRGDGEGESILDEYPRITLFDIEVGVKVGISLGGSGSVFTSMESAASCGLIEFALISSHALFK